MSEVNDDDDKTQLEDELVTLPDGTTEDDVEYGVPYQARVNDAVEYGVFVALSGSYPNDVGGLIHKSNLPTLHTPDDFAESDLLAVQLRDRTEKGLSLELVKVLDGLKGTTGVRGTAVKDHSPEMNKGGEDTSDSSSSSATVNGNEAEATRSGADSIEAITSRLDDIEQHLASDDQNVRARVLDADGDMTLLRVLDGGMTDIELEKGAIISVSLAEVKETAPEGEG